VILGAVLFGCQRGEKQNTTGESAITCRHLRAPQELTNSGMLEAKGGDFFVLAEKGKQAIAPY
jgi:hypothetical protein